MEGKTEHKPTLQKSPNYPNTSLDEAIVKVKILYEKDGKAGAPKKVALGYWGYNTESGPALRTISALKKFGLTEDKQGRIVPTQRAIDILIFPKENERYVNAIKEAALSPKIYNDLLNKYKDGFPSDESLKAELISEQNFNPKQVDGFLYDFRRTLEFVGLQPGESYEPVLGDEVKMDQPTQPVQRPSGGGTPPPAIRRLLNEFPIPLRKQNMATIAFNKLPLDKADLLLLKQWIDLMEANLTEPTENQ